MKVGDTVVLNSFGIHNIFGTTVGLRHMRTLRMKITYIGDYSWTNDCDTFSVRVDSPEIDRFMLLDRFFTVLNT